jgi:hypothetical protein
MGDRLRLCDVCNDKAAHTYKRQHGLTEVPIRRTLEVKDNRYQLVLANLGPNRLEYEFPFLEAPEYENASSPDRIDSMPDLLVVEHHIDELRNLDIIYRDGRFLTRRDDQVLLLEVFLLNIPRGDSVHSSASERGSVEDGGC